MKLKTANRHYQMTSRAEAAEQTERNILAAAVELWRDQNIDDITLQMIAKRARVTVQTIIRRFGSKEGVIESVIKRDSTGIAAQRELAAPGDVDQALDDLLAHYERDGDAVLRTLSIEDRFPIAKTITEEGRRIHRAACARVFSPYLPKKKRANYAEYLDAFVVATDIFSWKLLRRDLGRSSMDTRRVMRRLIDGLIANTPAHQTKG
ncbi:MAG: TetR/AcrR family transcriptional regulator [Oligoflexales bacterium]|nr:TetR/AcrR family transcriptional regulator [Oligoflexales bacterium]